MIRALRVAAMLFLVTATIWSQAIPEQLQGRWIIRRTIPTQTISCWDYKQARILHGTTIEYTADSLRWKDRTASHPGVSSREISADDFRMEYSGSGTPDSFVDFRQLGIKKPAATLVVLAHEAIAPIEGADALPGDTVLIKDNNTIIISVCNVYFEARRIASQPHQRAQHPGK